VLNRVVSILGALLVSASGGAFATGNAAVGQSRAQASCAACHGPTGAAPTDAWPNLAGQGYAYIVKQLKAFRDGTRHDELMERNAKPLSNEDIENLASYFSTLKPGVVPANLPTQAAPAVAVGPHAPIIATPEFIVPRPHPTRQYWADKLPDGPGRDIVVHKCQMCHDLQRAIAFSRPRQGWQEVVESMTRRGSPITPEEKPVLINYFTQFFGPESAPIPEVGMKPCKPGEWPKGSSDFRSKWKSPYNIWLSNQQGGSIDIVDPLTKKMLNRIKCVSAPDRLEFSRDGNTAYAPDRVERNVTVIDTRTGAIKAKIPLIARPNTSVLSRDYRKLYVGIWPLTGDEDKRGYVQVVSTDTLKVVKTIQTKGGIHDPWMSSDGKLLLAMSPFGQMMNVYDTTQDDKLLYSCCTEAIIGTMNMESGRDGSTSRIFLSYGGFYGIVVIDPKTGKELTRIEHPVHTDGPFKGIKHQPQSGTGDGFHGGEISPDGTTYWVMAGSYLYKYELPSLKSEGDVHLALIDQGDQPFSPAVEGTWLTISPDGQKVFAVRPGRDLLSIVDVKSMKEEALIPTGEYPLHISVWPRGTP
jgi:YVTN family beta-propeller protein